MARFRRRNGLPRPAGPGEHQVTLFERLDFIPRLVEVHDPVRPAVKLFCVVLAMMGMGLLLQASHAATILAPDAFASEVVEQAVFRILGLVALLVAFRLGPERVRAMLPVLVVVAGVLLLLVWAPWIGKPENGSHRWIRVPVLGLSFQPSEFARIVLVVWVADRCTRLGDRLHDLRRGLLPILAVCYVFFGLIALETDLGGALLCLCCFTPTLWVGGARSGQLASTALIGGATVVVFTVINYGYIRSRIAVFLGHEQNAQVSQSVEALGSGGLFGVGLGRGLYRNHGVPYQDSDYVFALVGEELGLFGMFVCLGLILALVWFSMRFVLSIRDRFAALVAFGLLLSVGLQAMIHMSVVTGLAPPKGMNLPFVSDGGTSLLMSTLAVGLALGAARARPASSPVPTPSSA
ncbi:MAG: FtsW/RodA/SpoVE family cell cycle protein [Planctomycetota bacterium]|jgi:cell division protein FtsW|nr:FtsW/RodA/SpoVE family cell cycle protein [Planctomycetota bacterium]MDP6764106.1 FtsW/RodA/SpoVE family cell cycle protein [Planctomycetota bacterium]MDP6988512.1 FtsW/RodA/SpoVE family cell cycle protein [Planctomycetota bacterium]